jgi:hypothetical protein
MRALRLPLLLALALIAAPAAAIDLESAKRQGLVGEQPDGYLGTVRQTPEAAELVRSVNQQRRQSYQDLAKRNGVAVESVSALAGRKLIDRAGSGEYVKDDAGRWVRR